MTTVLEALEQALRQLENVRMFLANGEEEMTTDAYLRVYGSIDNIPKK